MHVLVTGGAGFIGSHLVDALLARGDEVTILDDLSGGSAARVPPSVRLIEVDVANPASVELIAAIRADAVIHAAAQVSVARSMADSARDRAVNQVGVEHVLSGARRTRARKVVFLSSGGAIYGEAGGADEAAPPSPASHYAIHKYAAERYVELSGLSYGIARIANVYGPRQRSDLEGGVAAIFVARLAERKTITIFGSGEQRRDFVYVGDVVRAVVAMLSTEHSGTWNVGTGRPTTVLQLLRELEVLLGPAVNVVHEDPRPGDLFSSCLRAARIAAQLGWRPEVSLTEGLRRTVAAELADRAKGQPQ